MGASWAETERDALVKVIAKLEQLTAALEAHRETHASLDQRLTRIERFMWMTMGVMAVVVLVVGIVMPGMIGVIGRS